MENINEKKLDNFFREVIYEDWMDDEDYQEFIDMLYTIPSFNKKLMLDNISKNEENGISIDLTLDYYRKLINDLK